METKETLWSLTEESLKFSCFLKIKIKLMQPQPVPPTNLPFSSWKSRKDCSNTLHEQCCQCLATVRHCDTYLPVLMLLHTFQEQDPTQHSPKVQPSERSLRKWSAR